MRYIELFAGVGGFRLGIEQALQGSIGTYSGEHETENTTSLGQARVDTKPSERLGSCVFANEWDKYAAQTYNKNFGGQIDTRSITDISTDEIPDHDLLVGGFPCQAFSVAGKRGGFSDTRGTLFFDIARILAGKRPRYLLLENVKGLLSHDAGKTFQTILGVLSDLGYGVAWQVLNSKDFGVPQNRERVFIIGHLREVSRHQILPFGSSDESSIKQLNGRSHKDCGSASHPQVKVYQDTSRSAPKQNGKGWKHDESYTLEQNSNNKIAITSRTVRGGGGGSPYGSKQNWDSYKVEGRIRRLTPLECERLQGFPDNWTAGVSDTQRYKQMGNAVTVNVVEAVMRRLKAVMA